MLIKVTGEEKTAFLNEMTGSKKMTFGVLTPPKPIAPDEIQTLHEWGELDEILPIPDAANLIAALCRQNPAAIQKVIVAAIRGTDKPAMPFWGASHDGRWEKWMVRVWVQPSSKPKVRIGRDGKAEEIKVGFDVGKLSTNDLFSAPLHVEAMGVKPADVVALLVQRGRKVPAALAEFLAAGSKPENEQSPAPAAPPPAPAAEKPVTIKRQALIDKHLPRWPTVENDLNEASRNDLKKEASVAHGVWDEQKALVWAESRGKLIGGNPAARIAGHWPGPVLVHKIQG